MRGGGDAGREEGGQDAVEVGGGGEGGDEEGGEKRVG